MEKHCSNPQYFKEKNYKAKFLTNLIFKSKINKNNFEKKLNEKKQRKVEKKNNFKRKTKKNESWKKLKNYKKKKKREKCTVNYYCNLVIYNVFEYRKRMIASII